MSTLVLGSYQYQVLPTDVNGYNLAVSVSNVIPALSGGSGAPSGTPIYGAGTLYVDTTNFALYVFETAAWHSIAQSAATVTGITGTANQITASAATGAVTLSITSNPIIPGTASINLPQGTTAQRPGAPAQGMIRYNTDEDILEAYAIPYTVSASPIGIQRTQIYRKRRVWVDEFVFGSAPNAAGATNGTQGYGDLVWAVTASATPTNTLITGIADHPGILSLGTNAATTNTTSIHIGNLDTTAVVMANQVEYFAFLVKIPTITNVDIEIGLGDAITSLTFGANSVRFQFIPGTSANWQFFTRAAGVTPAAVSCGAVAANTWYLLEAFFNGTTWTPVVNGVQFTAQTANIPTVAVNVGMLIENTSAAARTIQIDYFAMYTTELGARFP